MKLFEELKDVETRSIIPQVKTLFECIVALQEEVFKRYENNSALIQSVKFGEFCHEIYKEVLPFVFERLADRDFGHDETYKPAFQEYCKYIIPIRNSAKNKNDATIKDLVKNQLLDMYTSSLIEKSSSDFKKDEKVREMQQHLKNTEEV